ncbi:MAG: hypothetical protein V7K94_02720 [Nostoc sp.]|uniref:hypothetical protein n=1 Tax=Nostoc sp. TaxID=1180 RepID=UPI002FFCC8F8
MRKFRKVITIIILSTLLGIPLALLSLWYQIPPRCKQFCFREAGGGESLTAGFPFPILHDEVGSSPTSGWGRIGIEDFFTLNLEAFLLDAFLYGVIIVMLFAITKRVFKSVKRSIR